MNALRDQAEINGCVTGVTENGLYAQIHNPDALNDNSANVLICPTQFMTTLSRSGYYVLSELALRTDSVVFGYDHPGTGSSRPMTAREAKALRRFEGYELTANYVWQDIKAAIPHVDERKIVIAGNSMGAYAGVQLMAVAKRNGIESIQQGIVSELAAIIEKKKTIAEGLGKYILESLIARGRFPYEPSQGVQALPEPSDRVIDRTAMWAYIDAFRHTTSRRAIRHALNGQPDMDIITIHGGASLLSPDENYDTLIPGFYHDRWQDVEYTFARHNITDNPRVFALLVSSFLEDFRPTHEDTIDSDNTTIET